MKPFHNNIRVQKQFSMTLMEDENPVYNIEWGPGDLHE